MTIKLLQDGLRKANVQIKAQKEAAEQELQDAHDVQMGLMPESALPIEGLELAGRCLPANTVSGDFFDYLEGKHRNEMLIVIADVTGKAMRGAMNAVMADGILRMAAEEMDELSPARLMNKMNDVLKLRIGKLMYVTMQIGKINTDTKILTLANAGHHALPILSRNSEVQFLEVIGGFPLGMEVGAKYDYDEVQFQL